MRVWKVLYISLIVICTVLSGCWQTSKQTVQDKNLVNGVTYYDNCIAEFESRDGKSEVQLHIGSKTESDTTANYSLNDLVLQEAARQSAKRKNFDNKVHVAVFAWEMLSILEELNYITKDCYPVSGQIYANDVMRIVYNNDQHMSHKENDYEAHSLICDFEISVFVSKKDGHVIHVDSPLT